MSCCIFVHRHFSAWQGSKKLTSTYPPVQTAPEIQRTSLVSAVLYLKSLPLNIDVLGFDYLDSPAASAYVLLLLPANHAISSSPHSHAPVAQEQLVAGRALEGAPRVLRYS